MRQFYLGKNQNSYYRVYFVDHVTGVRGPGKNTHTKDKQEATMLACKWLTMRINEKGFKRLLINRERVWLRLILKSEWYTE